MTATTFTPLAPEHVRRSVHVPLTATAFDAIHHGAGTSGNTSRLRTQEGVQLDGGLTATPLISGNSFRHKIRDALAWHLATTLRLPPGSLTKIAVDLLWTGGALTQTGAEVNLDLMRRTDRLLPALGLLGYAAKSDITAGTLTVNNFHLLCRENLYRVPLRLRDHPHAELPAGRFRGTAFGTRHDVAGSPPSFLADTLEGVATNQMIYDLQVLKPGAVLYSRLELAAATPAHFDAVTAALELAAPVVEGLRETRLGAKAAVGYGRCALEYDESLLPSGALERHTARIVDAGDAVVELLRELAA